MSLLENKWKGLVRNMKYIKIAVKTTTEAVDLVSNLFDDLGIEGVQIEDNIPLSEEDKKAMYIDILLKMEPDDGNAIVSSYIDPENVNVEELAKQLEEGLEELSIFMNVGDKKVITEEMDDADWLNNWKEFFKPFRVSDDIVIKPTWEKLEEVKENDLVIEIDPGTAFGTGAHETTKLCILGLRKYITSETKLLDVGCGSGILSIIGLKLGAQSAVGIDIDPAALIATYENAEVNHITKEQFRAMAGNIIEDEKMQEELNVSQYDIVVANILADVIIPLSAILKNLMRSGALFISSGIIDMKKIEVEEAILSNDFEIIEINEMGDWVSFVAKKK